MIGACCGSKLVKMLNSRKKMDRRPVPYVKRFRDGGCVCNDPKGLAWIKVIKF